MIELQAILLKTYKALSEFSSNIAQLVISDPHRLEEVW